MNVSKSIDELIGKTPLIELCNIQSIYKLKATIFAKLEYTNPTGSVKDRAAKFMLDEAEKKGLLSKDSIIVEPTSGNTGIGLASLAAARGYKITLTMSESMSIERQKLLKAYGANIVLTEASKGMQGAIDKAHEILKSTPNAFMPSQFTNYSNVQAHKKTTGPEIWQDTDGKVDIFIAGIGTGGTITGTGEYLKAQNPSIKVYGIEPKNSPFLSEGRAGTHGLQGIGAGFCPEILNKSICDELIQVTEDEAYKASRLLATEEGILVGISSGAALHTAIELAQKEENKQKYIVVLLPDTGERYLSTPLFQ